MTNMIKISFYHPSIFTTIERIESSLLQDGETIVWNGSISLIEITVSVDRSVELMTELVSEGFLD